MPTTPWINVNALGEEGAFKTLVNQAGFEEVHLQEVNNPISGSMDLMKAMSLRGLLSVGIAAEQEQRR